MAEFKKGAFTVAAKEKTPVVPVTLDGTGALMRNGTLSVIEGLLSHAIFRLRAILVYR